MHIEPGHVRMNRNQIVRERAVHDAPQPLVGDRLLVQSHADAADQSANILAAREQRVEDAARGVRGGDPRHPHLGKFRIDADFREHRAVAIRAMSGPLIRLRARKGLQRIQSAAPDPIAATLGLKPFTKQPRGTLDGRRETGCCHRAAGVGPGRQLGIPQLYAHLLRRHAENRGGELRQNGICPRADVLSSAANAHRTVPVDADRRFRRHSIHGITRRRHAPAQSPAAVAQSADRRRARVPSKTFRSHAVALAQVIARPGKPGVLIVCGVVAQAQFQRIDPQLECELVERGLERKAPGPFPRPTHRIRLRGVQAHEPVRRRNVCAFIQHPGGRAVRIGVIAEHRGLRDRVVHDGSQTTGARRG